MFEVVLRMGLRNSAQQSAMYALSSLNGTPINWLPNLLLRSRLQTIDHLFVEPGPSVLEASFSCWFSAGNELE